MADLDFHKPYLEMIFRLIRSTDMRTLRVEGTLSLAGQEKLATTI
jgi:hypothetical protein